MKSIALIAKFFGAPIDYLRMWFFAATQNPTINFIFLTDNANHYAEYQSLTNVAFVPITEEEFVERALKACPGVTSICMKDFGYHCNQFRPMFGVMFADLLAKYDYWGYVDTDVLLGDVRSFFPDELLDNYDKFLYRGHLTLFRNSPSVNERYLLSTKHCKIDYKKICATALNFGFDEMHGINRIYAREHIPFYCNHDIVLDCHIFENELSPQNKHRWHGTPIWFEYIPPKLYCNNTKTGERIEVVCAHFQKRRMSVPSELNETHYVVIPNEIVPLSKCNLSEAKKRASIKTPQIVLLWRRSLAKIRNIPRYLGLLRLFIKRV